jgi:DNA invertase Pin-like site-specific DNA recombinase
VFILDGPGLLDQAAGNSLLLPSHDDDAVPDHSWRITDEQRAEVRRLYADGLSVSKIAKLTGMAWATARLILGVTSTDSTKSGS